MCLACISDSMARDFCLYTMTHAQGASPTIHLPRGTVAWLLDVHASFCEKQFSRPPHKSLTCATACYGVQDSMCSLHTAWMLSSHLAADIMKCARWDSQNLRGGYLQQSALEPAGAGSLSDVVRKYACHAGLLSTSKTRTKASLGNCAMHPDPPPGHHPI